MKKQTLIIPTIIALGASVAANSVYADTASTDFSITVNPSVSLSIEGTPHLSITPNKEGFYDSTSIDVKSSTNSTAGYTLVMTTNSTSLVSDVVNVNTGANPTIPSITESLEGISASAFETSTDPGVLNHWGLALVNHDPNNNGNFNAIKSEQTINTYSSNVVEDVTTLIMASNLDLNTVPGIYSTTLNFQLTANIPVVTLEDSYAAHGKAKATISGNQYYSMQDMSTSICEYANVVPSSLEVYDSRDNTIYTIGKLADDRCWLLDNLALDPLANGVSITAANTNASAEAITNFLGGSASALHTGWSTDAVAVQGSTSVFDSPLYYAGSKDLTRADITNPIDSLTEANDWKFGIYYNYCAASMGTYCYTSGQGIDKDGTSAIDANQDICPAGWRMPTGGPIGTAGTTTEGGGEYENLYSHYSGGSGTGEGSKYANYRIALHLPLSGTFFNGSTQNHSNYGYFWSSTYSTNSNVYYLNLNAYSLYTQNDIVRSSTYNVRCIAK